MTEELIVKLFRQTGLGTVVPPVAPVSGGFLHRMYRVNTKDRSFAVKRLNPEIMQRPAAMENFRRAEELEAVLETAGLPVVAAMELNGRKMQTLDGAYFYIFPWHNGTTTDWYHTTAEQCRIAGSIQGRIHALVSRQIDKPEPERCKIPWTEYVRKASAQNSELAPLLRENEALLVYAQEQMDRAGAALPGIETITNEDMDPKNVMWDGGKPAVIDLECLEYGNPVSSAIQLSLQWAGSTICDLDFAKLKAFFDGYLEAYDNGFRAYDRVFGLAFTWIEWLEYNLKRALGQCQDENERDMGLEQVKLTLARLRYLRDMEEKIKQHMRQWFSPCSAGNLPATAPLTLFDPTAAARRRYGGIPMIIQTIRDTEEKQDVARAILEALPEWFGIPEARESYIRESAGQIMLGAMENGETKGFLCLKETGKDTLEIAVMGVRKECHRQGVGRSLVEAAKQRAREMGYSFLQVKTVQMGRYPEYDATNRFYLRCGFREFEVFPTLWDEQNPCQVYVMALGVL